MMKSVSNARKLATWHAIALILDALTVTIMDTSHQIALTKYHLQAHQQDAGTTPLVGMTDQHLKIITTPGITTMTIGISTDSVDLNLTCITLDIGVAVTVILTEVTLDPFIGPHTVAHCATGDPAHTTTNEIHHIADPHHAGISPEMTVDPEHINPTNTITNPSKRSSSSSQPTAWKPKDRKYKQVTIDDPPSEYYSSDEQDSDSEDDLN